MAQPSKPEIMPSKSNRIAIAGGASPGVGLTLANTLTTNGFTVIILTRGSPPSESPRRPDGQLHQLRTVDYSDVDSISTVLESERIDTVISTIPSGLPAEIHLNLIQAAKQCPTVRRFVPSQWGAGQNVNRQVTRFNSKHEALKSLLGSGLEYTCIYPGQYFMNYLAQASSRNTAGQAMSGLSQFTIPVDFANKQAQLPADASQPLVFTRLQDLAEGVVDVLKMDVWVEHVWIVGDTVSWNEVVRLAEQITGSAFDVTRYSLEELSRKVSETTGKEQMLWQLQVCAARGDLVPSSEELVLRPEGSLTVKDFLEQWWCT